MLTKQSRSQKLRSLSTRQHCPNLGFRDRVPAEIMPRMRFSEGGLLPGSFRWRDIKAWYDYHFSMRSPWRQVR